VITGNPQHLSKIFEPPRAIHSLSYISGRYMSISFHVAELVQKIRISAVAERKENLLRARSYYERFVKLLDAYDVLGKSDAKFWEAYLEDKDHFSTASTRDAAARREAKISRFREEKELKRKLEVSPLPVCYVYLHMTSCSQLISK
jgi:immunoglobulin-binding protein 1